MLNLALPPRRRRASLTPMIDVVFLLLVFFMLAARFGTTEALPLSLSRPAAGAAWSGPPRLVSVAPQRLLLNGVETGDLPAALAPLMETPGDIILLRPAEGTDTQRLVTVLSDLRAAGFTSLAILEARP
ncbi:ExbD/TolR family protein [Salipiger sp.]|uniref:ExbD/TolR family protein n=1 Tax=Salipiger sp. TaxID=2078585 RepID=UPI003A97994C